MAKGYNNSLNTWQQHRVPQIAFDESFQENIQRMADAGELPKGLIGRVQKRLETEDYIAILGYDTEKREWMFKRTDKSDGTILNLRGSREDIHDGLQFEKALLQRTINDLIEEEENSSEEYMEEKAGMFSLAANPPRQRIFDDCPSACMADASILVGTTESPDHRRQP